MKPLKFIADGLKSHFNSYNNFSFYDAIRNGEKTRKIDCKYYILKTPLTKDHAKQ